MIKLRPKQRLVLLLEPLPVLGESYELDLVNPLPAGRRLVLKLSQFRVDEIRHLGLVFGMTTGRHVHLTSEAQIATMQMAQGGRCGLTTGRLLGSGLIMSRFDFSGSERVLWVRARGQIRRQPAQKLLVALGDLRPPGDRSCIGGDRNRFFRSFYPCQIILTPPANKVRVPQTAHPTLNVPWLRRS